MPLLHNLSFTVYLDDLDGSSLSGNKIHKLKPHFTYAHQNNIQHLISFGGPYSNHLHALAWAGKQSGLQTTGFIRGELHSQLNPTLKDCADWGMSLTPLPRQKYRECLTFLENSHSEGCLGRELRHLIPDIPSESLLIPEGGSNQAAVQSLAIAYQSLFKRPKYKDITHAVCATGTGATVAGLRLAAPKHVKVIGIQSVAEGPATSRRIKGWIGDRSEEIRIIEGHLGGFAKMPKTLLNFITEFEEQHQIPLDPIYNGKTFFKLSQMAQQGLFETSDRVLLLHTGGLQGRRGNVQRTPTQQTTEAPL